MNEQLIPSSQSHTQRILPFSLHANPSNTSVSRPSASLKEYYSNPKKDIESTLNTLFPTHLQENKIQHARGILGETGRNLTEEQIRSALTDFELLLNTWLDEFEQLVFEGKTLKDLLKIDA